MNFLKVFVLLVTVLVTIETRSEEPFLETSIEALQDLLESNETNSVELVWRPITVLIPRLQKTPSPPSSHWPASTASSPLFSPALR